MPIYDYHCEKCDEDYEIVKSIKEYDGKDQCPQCGNIGKRILSCQIQFMGTKIENAEYNPGLGCITKGKRHRDEIAKSRGLIEIGNECPEKIEKSYKAKREEKRKKAWDEV
jgi:putative FmdB family regulatory protein